MDNHTHYFVCLVPDNLQHGVNQTASLSAFGEFGGVRTPPPQPPPSPTVIVPKGTLNLQVGDSLRIIEVAEDGSWAKARLLERGTATIRRHIFGMSTFGSSVSQLSVTQEDPRHSQRNDSVPMSTSAPSHSNFYSSYNPTPSPSSSSTTTPPQSTPSTTIINETVEEKTDSAADNPFQRSPARAIPTKQRSHSEADERSTDFNTERSLRLTSSSSPPTSSSSPPSSDPPKTWTQPSSTGSSPSPSPMVSPTIRPKATAAAAVKTTSVIRDPLVTKISSKGPPPAPKATATTPPTSPGTTQRIVRQHSATSPPVPQRSLIASQAAAQQDPKKQPTIVKVYFQDGTYRNVAITHRTTSREVCNAIMSKVGLDVRYEATLLEVVDGTERTLEPKENPLGVTQRWTNKENCKLVLALKEKSSPRGSLAENAQQQQQHPSPAPVQRKQSRDMTAEQQNQ